MEAATLVGSLLCEGQIRTELVATEVRGNEEVRTGFEDGESENSLHLIWRGRGSREEAEASVPRNHDRVCNLLGEED